MENPIPQENTETVPVTRSGRKRKVTARMAENNAQSGKRAAVSAISRLPKSLLQLPGIPRSNDNTGISKQKLPRSNGVTFRQCNQLNSSVTRHPQIAAKGTVAVAKVTDQQPAVNGKRVEDQLDRDISLEVVQSHTKDGQHQSTARQKTVSEHQNRIIGGKKKSLLRSRKSTSFSNGGPQCSNAPIKAASGLHGGVDQQRQNRHTETLAIALNSSRQLYSPSPTDQVPEPKRRDVFASKNQPAESPHNTDLPEQGELEGEGEVHDSGNGICPLQNGSQGTFDIRSPFFSRQKEGASITAVRQTSLHLPGDSPNPIATLNAAIEAAKTAQSGSFLLQKEKRTRAKTSNGREHPMPVNSRGTPPIHDSGSDAVGRAVQNAGAGVRLATPSTELNAPIILSKSASRKQRPTPAVRVRRNITANDRQATSYLASINENLLQLLNDQNEHNKAVRERLDRMDAERVEDRKREQDRHKQVCKLLIDLGRGHDVSSPAPREKKARFSFSLLEGCCAMLRYVYSLAGRVIVSAKYMYPTTKTQEELMHYIAEVIIEMDRNEQREGRVTDDLRSRNENGFGETAGNSAEGMESGSVADLQAASIVTVENGLSSEVYAFLGSKIVITNRMSVIEPSTDGKEHMKHSVKLRLLDQRRRFHDHISTPIVNKWLRSCNGFETFDTSLKTMKQDSKVFEAAAKIFGKDTCGSRGYLKPETYGNAFVEACMTLKRMSEDHTDRALAQAMRIFQNSDKLLKICGKVTAFANRGDSEISSLQTLAERKDIFFTHQLAFVQTKVHARLEWLSQCQVSGGKSVSKPDRSHYASYLGYVMSMEKLLKTLIPCNPDGADETLERTAYELLGVSITSLSKRDVTMFMEEFYGESDNIERRDVFGSSGRQLVSMERQPAGNNALNKPHSLTIGNGTAAREKEIGTGQRTAEFYENHTTDNESLLDEEESDIENESYYEEES